MSAPHRDTCQCRGTGCKYVGEVMVDEPCEQPQDSPACEQCGGALDPSRGDIWWCPECFEATDRALTMEYDHERYLMERETEQERS